MATMSELRQLEEDNERLQSEIRCALAELNGCGVDCSKEFHRMCIDSTKRILLHAVENEFEVDDGSECSALEPLAVNVAPIARLEIRNGVVEHAGMYAPGLPDGEHDLFPVPLDPKGALREWPAHEPESDPTPGPFSTRAIAILKEAAGDSADWSKYDKALLDIAYEADAMVARAAPPPSAWHPIETAPKDGSEILGYRSDCGVLIIRWTSPDEFLHEAELEEIGSESAEKEDWFCADFIAGGRLEGDEAPTHWQPLTAPPTSASTKES